MKWAKDRQSLETYVDGLNLGLPIAWENVSYNPVAGNPFLRVMHFPVDTDKLTIGNAGLMDSDGIMVLGLNYPAGMGSGDALENADAISAAFLVGQSIAADDGYIVFRRCTLEPKEASSDPDWWVLPVMVFYNAYHHY